MNKNLFIAALLALAATTACKDSDKTVDTFVDTGNGSSTTTVKYEIPAPLTDRPEIILERKGYTVSYNQEAKTPNWVAWHLTSAHSTGSNKRDNEEFTEDTDVPEPRATDEDYYGSGYDRGHMCPAADNKWSAEAMTQSFLFTNICPQNNGLNKYEWNDVEQLCRKWAQKYSAVDIVCGPIYEGQQPFKTIGPHKVWVADRFFKVVLRRGSDPKAIGFIYRNRGVTQTYDEAVTTVDAIEQLTGIDFFPALDDAVERKVEAEVNRNDWTWETDY